jgi:hypothetical protein
MLASYDLLRYRGWDGRTSVPAGFAAGFLATLLFHQVAVVLLQQLGVTERAAFSLRSTWPFGLPSVVSLAFWGGLWGIAFAATMMARIPPRGAAYWVTGLLFGAIAPTVVNWLVVAPMRGLPAGYGWHPSDMLTSILANSAWGLGTAALLRPARRGSFSPSGTEPREPGGVSPPARG